MPFFLSEPKNTNEDNTLSPANVISLGDPDNVDCFYIVGTGIGAVEWTGFGDPADTDGSRNNLNNILTTHKILFYDDKDYIFYLFQSKTSGPKTLTFTPKTGETLNIEKLFLFETLIYFDDDNTFVRVDMGSPEVGAVFHEDLYYGESKVAGYIKNRISYTAKEQPYKDYYLFELFRKNNPHFYFLEDYKLFNNTPHKLYPATLDGDVNTRYSLLDKREGLDIDFSIRER